MLNGNNRHGVFAAQDFPKIEHLIALHFDQCARAELHAVGIGRSREPQPLPVAAFDPSRMEIAVGQSPDLQRFFRVGHFPDCTPIGQPA